MKKKITETDYSSSWDNLIILKKKQKYIKETNSVSEISESKFLQRVYKNIVATRRIREKSVDFSNIKKKSVNNVFDLFTIFIDSDNNSDNNSNNN